ncbi:MAG: LacI family DNA-binding transcriptional regulator [Bacillota bacterium]|nr:LacI family DNA-binding transcriptional regulator [Bacillota bacterium]
MNSKEIAKLAGVSRATVSRVINNSANVQPETRERVMEIIKENHYVPIEHARMLAGKVTKVIGMFIVDIETEDAEARVSNSSYFSQFVNSVVDRAKKYGYNVLVSIVGSVADFENVKKLFLNKSIAGGIFIGEKSDDTQINELLKFNLKMVVVDREPSGDGTVNSCITVNWDNIGGGYAATRYLIELGHRKIGHLAGDLKKLSGTHRFEGYKRALKDAGIDIDESLIARGTFSEASGYRETKKLLSVQKPTAIFVGNDSMAIGAMNAIKEMGMKIPEDISIIGFDNIELSKYVSPALTTMSSSLFEIASICVENLISSIENEANIAADFTIPLKLVERESCRAIK